jgi:hypothetical protein
MTETYREADVESTILVIASQATNRMDHQGSVLMSAALGPGSFFVAMLLRTLPD